MSPTDIYLGLGSNQGDRHDLLLGAIDRLARRIGDLVLCSSFIETEPWGFESEHPFLNAVALYRTTLTPREVLAVTQDIERELGRRQKTNDSIGYQDRPIDIDILLYGSEHIDEPDLKIPHPLMEQREFVMRPLNELRNLLSQNTVNF